MGHLTPEQQLQLLSVKGITASDTMSTLEHYRLEADYRVNYRKFASLINNSQLCIAPINVIILDDHNNIKVFDFSMEINGEQSNQNPTENIRTSYH